MRFKAHYEHTKKESPDYWRTVDADSEPEAHREARRMIRRGYILVGMPQDMFGALD